MNGLKFQMILQIADSNLMFLALTTSKLSLATICTTSLSLVSGQSGKDQRSLAAHARDYTHIDSQATLRLQCNIDCGARNYPQARE